MKGLKLFSFCMILSAGQAFAQFYDNDTSQELFRTRSEIRQVQDSLFQALGEINTTAQSLNRVYGEMNNIDQDIEVIIPYRSYRGDRLSYNDRQQLQQSLRELRRLQGLMDRAYRDASQTLDKINRGQANLSQAISAMEGALDRRPNGPGYPGPNPGPRPHPGPGPRPQPGPQPYPNPYPGPQPFGYTVTFYTNPTCAVGRNGSGAKGSTILTNNSYENRQACDLLGRSDTGGRSVTAYSISGRFNCVTTPSSLSLVEACDLARKQVE